MLILTVNVGSSSLRLQLYASSDGQFTSRAAWHHAGEHHVSHATTALATLCSQAACSPADIDCVVHRMVHGGEHYRQACWLSPHVYRDLQQCAALAPLHNPATLAWMAALQQALPKAAPAVCFDTAFYAQMPEVARLYALPRALCTRYALQRYGFHGLAHAAMWQAYAAHTPGPQTHTKLVSLQLGSGCSATATRGGVAQDTSMGYSPLEGLMMGSRCGDIDASVVLHLQQAAQLSITEVASLLQAQAGLKGVANSSQDMQQLLGSHDVAAKRAIALFCYRIVKYVAAYAGVLGGLDALVFGGGIGEHAAPIRQQIVSALSFLGLQLDAAQNNNATPRTRLISSADSRVAIWVVGVDEALIMAQQVAALAPNAASA